MTLRKTVLVLLALVFLLLAGAITTEELNAALRTGDNDHVLASFFLGAALFLCGILLLFVAFRKPGPADRASAVGLWGEDPDGDT